MKTLGDSRSGAIFSDDMKFRYRLWRVWDPSLPRACFCMLNPSKADEIDNDATVERQERRVRRWRFTWNNFRLEFGAIEVINACALISTDPQVLFDVEDPVGDDNGGYISLATHEAISSRGIVVCGWGSHLAELSSGKYTLHDLLLDSLEADGIPVHAFELNANQTPKHPLYVGYEVLPRLWSEGALHDSFVEYVAPQPELFA